MRERTELAACVARVARSGDVVLTMGAGDVTRTGPELLALLEHGAVAQGGAER